MTTRVSGVTSAMWRFASTPPFAGMLRSMTTTSGVSSLTCARASAPVAASPTISSACSSSRFLRPVRKRSWSSTSSTRSGSVWRSSAVSTSSVTANPPSAAPVYSVNRDGDGAAPPGCALRGRHPEVDDVAFDPASDVCCHAVAVAGDVHLRAERNHGRVDRDDARADGHPGRGAAGQVIAGGAHRELPLAGRGRSRRLLQGLRLLLGGLCLRLDASYLLGTQPLLRPQRRDVGGPGRCRRCEPLLRLPGGGQRAVEPALLHRQQVLRPEQAAVSGGCRSDDLLTLVCGARQGVELTEPCAERLRSEHDGYRIDVAPLVHGA